MCSIIISIHPRENIFSGRYIVVIIGSVRSNRRIISSSYGAMTCNIVNIVTCIITINIIICIRLSVTFDIIIFIIVVAVYFVDEFNNIDLGIDRKDRNNGYIIIR